MAHISENSNPLRVKQISVQSRQGLLMASKGLTDVCVVRLPACDTPSKCNCPLDSVGALVATIANNLEPSATLIILGEVTDLVQVQAHMPVSVRYQHWIAIKRTTTQIVDKKHLPHQHFGALVHTRYKQCLRHTKMRIRYTYCPVCDKTTKDYGGKKHTYHEAGTLISDVWRDISCDLDGDISPVIDRFADLFGIEPYQELVILDCRLLKLERSANQLVQIEPEENRLPTDLTDRILHSDCLEALKRIPSSSIDFAFTDPPYNLGKKYMGYTDDLKIQDYFKWCDEWIGEMARVLKPGHTLAVLNIPLWIVRHFLYRPTEAVAAHVGAVVEEAPITISVPRRCARSRRDHAQGMSDCLSAMAVVSFD